MTAAIARKYGCEMRYVLTGFKYIGEQITALSDAGTPERYQLGFEESYGYLAGTHARDKDAVVASMLICEMASYYRLQGKSLLDVLRELYDEFGVYEHQMLNVMFEGEKGMYAMRDLMAKLRADFPKQFGGKKTVRFSDYGARESLDVVTGEKTAITLPQSEVLVFDLEDNASVIVRPSGTEPKVKAYITATGKTREEAVALAERLKADAKALIEG